MKRILILFILAMTYAPEINGQNLFFIGENSYPSTETFTLQSNSDRNYINDLNLIFAKDGAKGLLVVSSKLVSNVRISGKLVIYLENGTAITCFDSNVRISGKLVIYLENGTAITCFDRGIKDNVDDIASSAYHLTYKELTKMKTSNINTILYIIKCTECLENPLYEGNYSASNNGSLKTDFTAVITDFYKK